MQDSTTKRSHTNDYELVFPPGDYFWQSVFSQLEAEFRQVKRAKNIPKLPLICKFLDKSDVLAQLNCDDTDMTL